MCEICLSGTVHGLFEEVLDNVIFLKLDKRVKKIVRLGERLSFSILRDSYLCDRIRFALTRAYLPQQSFPDGSPDLYLEDRPAQ